MHPWLREAGVAVTPYTAVEVAAVYGSCRLIVDCLAPAEIKSTERKTGGIREDRDDDPVAWTLNYGAPVALAPDAPTAQAIEEALYWSALLLGDGNGYAEIQRDMAGRFFALWPINPTWVEPRYDENGVFHYAIRSPRGTARLEAINMFHLRGPSLHGFGGDATVLRAAKAIGIAHAAQVFSAAYFANGTVISGLLTSDKNVTPKQAKEAKEEWKELHGSGPGSAHGISVLGQGLKYEAINHNAQESQLIEARRFQVQEIARFYGVPTTLLADNEAWTNLSELYRGFYTHTLRGWAERFDAEATRKLYPQRQPWREIHHDLTHLTLGSFKDQVAALFQATGNKPLWTQNEARAVFGKNSVPGGDEIDPPAPPALPAKSQPEEPEKDPQREERPTLNVGREAVVAMYADAFRRHEKRTANRRKDVKRELTEADRENLRERLVEDSASASAFAKRVGLCDADPVNLAAYADAIEQGEPPEKAAERLVVAMEAA